MTKDNLTIIHMRQCLQDCRDENIRVNSDRNLRETFAHLESVIQNHITMAGLDAAIDVYDTMMRERDDVESAP